MYTLLAILLALEISIGEANPVHTESDVNLKSQLIDPSGEIKSSDLQVNKTYSFVIKGYPDQEHLLVLDFSNVRKNKFKIFGDKVNKKSSCLTYHLKGSESCRSTWMKSYKNCPLQTMASQDILMTLRITDLSEPSLIKYKTVNCTSGAEVTQKMPTTECQSSNEQRTETSGLSTLEFILMIALVFAGTLAVIFASALLRIACRTRHGAESSSAEDFVYKQRSRHARESPIVVDNVLYASVDGGATKL